MLQRMIRPRRAQWSADAGNHWSHSGGSRNRVNKVKCSVSRCCYLCGGKAESGAENCESHFLLRRARSLSCFRKWAKWLEWFSGPLCPLAISNQKQYHIVFPKGQFLAEMQSSLSFSCKFSILIKCSLSLLTFLLVWRLNLVCRAWQASAISSSCSPNPLAVSFLHFEAGPLCWLLLFICLGFFVVAVQFLST